MKLNGSLLLVAAMVLGSFGGVGCKSNDKADKISDPGNNAAPTENAESTPEDNPEAAAVSEESGDTHDSPAGIEKDCAHARWSVGFGPPAVRVEERGVAPYAGWWWRTGYYGWGGRDYRWYPGRWYAPRPGYAYYGPRWHQWGSRWAYRPGRWYRHY
jgi:hypothetical protein